MKDILLKILYRSQKREKWWNIDNNFIIFFVQKTKFLVLLFFWKKRRIDNFCLFDKYWTKIEWLSHLSKWLMTVKKTLQYSNLVNSIDKQTLKSAVNQQQRQQRVITLAFISLFIISRKTLTKIWNFLEKNKISQVHRIRTRLRRTALHP